MKRLILIAIITGLANIGFGQNGKFGATPEDSIECITNISLYQEFFKQGNYKDALPGWRKAVEICPKSRKSLYINGAKMYGQFRKQEKDKERRTQLFDTLMWIYDLRIEHFGEEGKVLERKGVDMFRFKGSDPKAAYDVMHKAFELRGEKTSAQTLSVMYQALYKAYGKEQATKEELLEMFPVIADVAEKNIKKGGKYASTYETALSNLEKLFSEIASCEDLISIYEPKYNAAPKDTNQLKTILKIFEKRDCTGEELYLKAAISLNEISPSCEASYGIAIGHAKKENYSEAIKFFKLVEELSCEDDLKEKAYIKMAGCYLITGQYSSVRVAAQKALAINSKNGDAYILIGDAYASSAKKCGDNECTNRAAYWVAADTYLQAKSVDPSVAEKASAKYGQMKAQFPKKDDCFFYNITEGMDYTVGCWINKTTKVRVRD